MTMGTVTEDMAGSVSCSSSREKVQSHYCTFEIVGDGAQPEPTQGLRAVLRPLIRCAIRLKAATEDMKRMRL